MSRSETKKAWQGYTMNELKQLRIENEADIETQKKLFLNRFNLFNSFRNKNKAIAGNVMTLMGYMDYIALGITLFRKLRKIFAKKK